MKPEERLAKGLGWFSIGLGLAQIVAPKALAQLIGAKNHKIMPLLGIREIASGIGILTQRRPTAWLWSRVAGDAMDLSLLGKTLSPDNPDQDRAIAATAAVLGVAALDLYCAQKLS